MRTRAEISQSLDPKVTLTIRIPLKEKIALVEEAKRRNITVTELKISHWPNPRPLSIKEKNLLVQKGLKL